jgi:hypothetical protein
VYELTGLARGGQQMSKLKLNYQKAVTLLVELASLQTSFITLDEVRFSCCYQLNITIVASLNNHRDIELFS